MDIERLKELKVWVNDLRKFGVSEGNEVITLIDEAIARQSVTSEEVAISKMETTSCEWCDRKTMPLFYVECARATIDDESQLISAIYCPNCGRRLED